MARYVIVKKDKEDDNFVYYTYHYTAPGEEYLSKSGKIRYKPNEVSGSMKVSKKNGDVFIEELAESDSGSNARCATWLLMRYWRNGEYPDRGVWAS